MINTKALVVMAQIIGDIYDDHIEQLSALSKIKSWISRHDMENRISVSINDSFIEKIKNRNDVKIVSLKYFNENKIAYSGNEALDIIDEQNIIAFAFFHQTENFDLGDIFQCVMNRLRDFDITID